jgi:hypothetical protein
MGSGWMIKTFDRAKWDILFGSGKPDAEQKLLDAMLWENDGYFDDDETDLRPGPNREQVLASQEGEQAKALARHLAGSGFTYEGLDATQAIQLDEFGSRLGSPEVLGDELDVKWHSPDFFHQSFASELFDRTGNNRSWSAWIAYLGHQPPRLLVQYLPLLLTGRRFGTNAEAPRSLGSYYIILSPPEAVALRHEAVIASNASIPWRRKGSRETVEDALLAPLSQVIESSRWTLMTLNY